MKTTEIGSFVGWLVVDNTGHERLMVWMDPTGGNIVPLLAFDREGEDLIDRLARQVVTGTGQPGRKVYFKRDRLLGEMF